MNFVSMPIFYAKNLKFKDVLAVLIGRHRISMLLGHYYFQNVISINPKIKRQYITSYLARSMTIGSRLQAVISHYNFMRDHFTYSSFGALLGNGLPLWSHEYDDNAFSMLLKHNATSIYEGDLLLIMYRGDVLLSQISLSIVPGHLVGLDANHALLIGSAQGAVPEIGEHGFAVKANGGVAPNHLLIAAARGIASALGLTAMAGVANADQLSKTDPRRGYFPFDYDHFWPMFGGTRNTLGFFNLPTAPYEPISSEKSSAHRRRSRKKALFKAEVAAQVENCLRSHVKVRIEAAPVPFGLAVKGNALAD
jgi:uncharacterized protein VirK/YbjX